LHIFFNQLGQGKASSERPPLGFDLNLLPCYAPCRELLPLAIFQNRHDVGMITHLIERIEIDQEMIDERLNILLWKKHA
jgi:hypothetical protein